MLIELARTFTSTVSPWNAADGFRRESRCRAHFVHLSKVTMPVRNAWWASLSSLVLIVNSHPQSGARVGSTTPITVTELFRARTQFG